MQALVNAGVCPIYHDGVLFPNSGLLPVLISLARESDCPSTPSIFSQSWISSKANTRLCSRYTHCIAALLLSRLIAATLLPDGEELKLFPWRYKKRIRSGICFSFTHPTGFRFCVLHCIALLFHSSRVLRPILISGCCVYRLFDQQGMGSWTGSVRDSLNLGTKWTRPCFHQIWAELL